jgi:hypothetical protein
MHVDPDCISDEMAIEWLASEYGLSIGAAEEVKRVAVASRNVRLWARFLNGEWDRISLDDFNSLPGRLLYRDRRLSFADLRTQVCRQIGESAEPVHDPRQKRHEALRAALAHGERPGHNIPLGHVSHRSTKAVRRHGERSRFSQRQIDRIVKEIIRLSD